MTESDKSRVIKRLTDVKESGTNIIVKDYLYNGNFVFGQFYQITDGVISYIMDDGDIFTLKEIEDMGCEYILINSEDIVNKFKYLF